MKSRRPTREETRLRILATADHLLRQYGHGKTTVADIAGELGMSTANVYKFFSSKNEIMEACAERNVGTIEAVVTRVVDGKGSAWGRVEGVVLAVFRFHQERFRNERQVFRLVMTAMDENWRCITRYNEFMHGTVSRLVKEGIACGEFRRAPVGATVQVLLDCLTVALHPHLRREFPHEGSERRVRAQLAFLERALR